MHVVKTLSNLDMLLLGKGECRPQIAGRFRMAYSEMVQKEQYCLTLFLILRHLWIFWMQNLWSFYAKPSQEVCKPAYLVPVPSQDKLGGLCEELHVNMG